MSKPSAPMGFEPPPYAPPPYSAAQGGVPPQAPFAPLQPLPTAIVTTVVPLGSQSTHMICPHCHAEVDTATKQSPSMIAYISGLVICLVGCWMGCCLIPCCIQDCMTVEHNCPNCKAFLGKYKRG